MLDNTGMTWLYVSNLLERGIRVLSYVGTFDFICNHIGNEMWLEALEWNGKEGYNKAELADWKVDGKFAGKFKSFGNLSVSSILDFRTGVDTIGVASQGLGSRSYGTI